MNYTEKSRAWRAANPGKSAEYSRKWRLNNPEKVKENNAKQRAKMTAKRRAAYNARYKDKRRAFDSRKTGMRKAFLNRWKLAAGCFDCGYAEHAVALDFDHVIGEKVFNLGFCYGRPWTTILAEVAKCVVRCSNCHRVRTHVK